MNSQKPLGGAEPTIVGLRLSHFAGVTNPRWRNEFYSQGEAMRVVPEGGLEPPTPRL